MGREAGLPLGRGLSGWRKIVVGDRNWRIIFTIDPGQTVATVWVVGDRDDAACYEDAQRCVQAMGQAQSQGASLAAVLFQLTQMQREGRRARRGR